MSEFGLAIPSGEARAAGAAVGNRVTYDRKSVVCRLDKPSGQRLLEATPQSPRKSQVTCRYSPADNYDSSGS